MMHAVIMPRCATWPSNIATAPATATVYWPVRGGIVSSKPPFAAAAALALRPGGRCDSDRSGSADQATAADERRPWLRPGPRAARHGHGRRAPVRQAAAGFPDDQATVVNKGDAFGTSSTVQRRLHLDGGIAWSQSECRSSVARMRCADIAVACVTSDITPHSMAPLQSYWRATFSGLRQVATV